MIQRTLTQKLLTIAQKFPVIAILGPRQSGKTTLAQLTFPDYNNEIFTSSEQQSTDHVTE